MKYSTFGVLLCLLLAIFCTQEESAPPKDVVDLVPLDNEISGWNRTSAMQIAENEAQLWDLINGEGQVYIDNGFEKCAFQNYTGDVGSTPSVELKLRIFDQGDTVNAKEVYDAVALGTETPWNETGHAGVEARYRLESGMVINYYVLEFWDEEFFVWIEIDDESQAALDVAKLFALNISSAIQDTTGSN